MNCETTQFSGNVEAFKSLVQAGGNRLALDRDRLGVLHCAASHGHSEIIRAMLELSSGNIVNVKDRNGDTPLFFAATYGHYDCAKLLLDNLADPNHLDHKLRTPAHCAAAKGQLRILKLLKQYGASFEFQNYRGDLPFHEACHTGSKDLIEWLISFQPNAINAANFHGRAPLHLAAATGDMELVILLCSRGAEVNALMLYKNELFTPRDVAERRGHDLIVEYLTQRHSALKHVDIPEDQRRMSKTNIEEQLRIARLQQAVASVESEDFLDSKWHPEKPFRRGKSMGNATYMVNTGVNTSRRSSSASAIRPRLPKSTSTTDLSAGQDKENFNSSEVVHHDRFVGGPEKKLVEETIQKLVHEELKRASAFEKRKRRKNGMRSASHGSKHGSHEESENSKEEMNLNNELDSENEENFDKVRFENEENENEHYNGKMNDAQKMAGEVSKVTKIRKMRGTNEKMRRSQASSKLLKTGNNMEYGENGKNGEDSGSGSSTKGDPYKPNHKKHLRSTSAKFAKHKDSNPNQTRRSTIENGDESEKFNQEVLKAILNRSGEQDLLYRLKHARNLDESENVDDLVDGRAYIHEKAIFQELTHLKRMQIQYGKVQEKILVRSLINNFCKMHGLNPKHFRYESFYSWEKFLYNQLKLIYLEERDRIQKISSRYPINRFESRLHKTMPLNDRIRELTRIYNGSTSVVTKTNSVKKYRPVTELPCEGQRKRCECLNKHILFE
uniref:ANK_REP_REGION domain-containing protein n=1 Tax=Acrobeloides nanus TaxID=290746 RepID=A0A914DU29_9BILA